jgi:hypothetical protein
MKFRNLSLRSFQLFVLTGAALVFISCKKKKEFNNETAQTTVDMRSALGEIDEVLKDINTVMMERYPLRGRTSGTSSTSVCGVTLDSLGELTGKMTMNYNGTDCYGRKKTGSVKFYIEDYPLRKWKTKGCVVHIEFINYQATRTSDGRFVRLEGTQTLVNESGNTWFELWYMNSSPVSYVHSGQNMRVTYTGDYTANISVNRRLTFTYSSGVTSCLVDGLDNQQARSRVEAWGEDISGTKFATEVTSPYTWKTTCGAVAPVNGAVTVVLDGKEFDLKCRYGLDKDGKQVAENSACPFGWEVTWSRKKRTNSRLFGYY